MVKTKHLMLLGGVAALGIGAYIVYGGGGLLPGKTYLTVVAGAGGSVFVRGVKCEQTPCTWEFSRGDTILLEASPDAGNYVLGWTVDGVSKGSDVGLYLTMNKDHNVVVSFTTEPPPIPPPNPPAKIIVQNVQPVMLKQYYKGFWDTDYFILKQLYWGVIRGKTFHVIPVDDYADWAPFYVTKWLTFQLLDLYDVPCANVPVRLYSTGVDFNGGRLFLAGKKYSDLSPLIAHSDSEGNVSVAVSYVQLALRHWSEKHLIQVYDYNWGLTRGGWCLYDQFVNHICDWIESKCTWEKNYSSYGPCPGCRPVYDTCPEVDEVETAPTGPTVYAEYTENPNVKASCIFNCWFGVKHGGTLPSDQPIPPPTPDSPTEIY